MDTFYPDYRQRRTHLFKKKAQQRKRVYSPQALAFDGPAYRGMDAATFSEEDWAFGARSVRLLSGLYGVLRPTDLIQPYRLEMGSRWVGGGL